MNNEKHERESESKKPIIVIFIYSTFSQAATLLLDDI